MSSFLGCLPNEFKCNSTTCIDGIKRCDRQNDCENAEDERDCGKYMTSSLNLWRHIFKKEKHAYQDYDIKLTKHVTNGKKTKKILITWRLTSFKVQIKNIKCTINHKWQHNPGRLKNILEHCKINSLWYKIWLKRVWTV